MPKKKEQIDFVDNSIINYAIDGLNIKQIAEKTGMSYSNVYPRVKKLAEKKILTLKKKEKLAGSPTIIEVSKKYKALHQKIDPKLEKIYTFQNKKKILTLLEKCNGEISKLDFHIDILKDDFDLWYVYRRMITEGLIEERIKITRLGKKLI